MPERVYVALDCRKNNIIADECLDDFREIVGIASTRENAIEMLHQLAKPNCLFGEFVAVVEWEINAPVDGYHRQRRQVWKAEIVRFLEVDEAILEEIGHEAEPI